MITTVFASEANTAYYLEFERTDGVCQKGMAALFDEENVLVSAKVCDIVMGDKVCSAEVDFKMEEKPENLRIFFPETQSTVKDFIKIEPAKVEIEEAPEVNAGKDEGKEEQDTQSMSKYPTELYAVTAYMMVKDASVVVENDETKTLLKVLYRGEESEVLVEDDIKILSAPSVNAELVGENASALKEGDIVYCSTTMNGRLRTIELIYRPTVGGVVLKEEDFGTNFESLFTYNGAVTKANPTPIAVFGNENYQKHQYAFGVIKDGKSGKYMTLTNKKGITEQDMIIDLHDNTVVYVFDAKKRDKTYIGTLADIEKSYFIPDSLDEDDNVISWSDEGDYVYALVRMGEGTALDVAVFINLD